MALHSSLEAASRLEAIASRLEAIALRLLLIYNVQCQCTVSFRLEGDSSEADTEYYDLLQIQPVTYRACGMEGVMKA